MCSSLSIRLVECSKDIIDPLPFCVWLLCLLWIELSICSLPLILQPFLKGISEISLSLKQGARKVELCVGTFSDGPVVSLGPPLLLKHLPSLIDYEIISFFSTVELLFGIDQSVILTCFETCFTLPTPSWIFYLYQDGHLCCVLDFSLETRWT